jgi:hypothetical protein
MSLSPTSIQHKLSGFAAHGGAVALGAGLLAPFSAGAALQITDLNATVTNGVANFDLIPSVSENDAVVVVTPNFGKIESTGVKDFTLWFLTSGSELVRLSEGDVVSESSGTWSSIGGYAYTGESGAWASTGAHGYVGLRFEFGNFSNYGWLELTRGSLTLGRFGFETDDSVGAAITPVPEPSTLMLMASGAAGLLALRRRRQQKAAAQLAVH